MKKSLSIEVNMETQPRQKSFIKILVGDIPFIFSIMRSECPIFTQNTYFYKPIISQKSKNTSMVIPFWFYMKKETKWYGVRLPEGLMKEIEKTIEENPHWSSKADFVKDAVRQLLNYYEELEIGRKRK